MRKVGFLLVFVSFTLIAACGGKNKGDTEKPSGDKSLYDRLGGEAAIKAVVDEFVSNVAADGRINGFFADTDIDNFKKLLVEQICEASGGPCTYTGRDMKSSHEGMGVNEAHWDATVEALVKALDKFEVPEREKNELLGAISPMKDDIVEE